ncbi:hypothetical protein GF359_07885 [candidate division WOR-3 bacterium]|uniref:Uncharacterized protein n=1 Tax=candidate division WOR-3 bacterium TaxID=2052148 RepID=A0A9D5KAI1_UNCW3|nr:hypothetical protein [candidate division WOR-3 bacterium]MBD3365120.1 hypothetical protein [candidate division WOR-3 bacterium]
METWGIVITIGAIIFGLTGVVFLFWGWNRKNRGLDAPLHFIIAAAGGLLFAGLIYLGARLGLLW